jgi:hypothetical protein
MTTHDLEQKAEDMFNTRMTRRARAMLAGALLAGAMSVGAVADTASAASDPAPTVETAVKVDSGFGGSIGPMSMRSGIRW